ncbi:MAG: hypothetical protein ACRCT7_09000 [Shewanella sp.]|uniref:hypothetical protein n=1 Tax=Shewanella sp. SNU WT4 TaxID=2590015 RepID=UPI001126F4CE|nr:hypothetical protein [Shewanella sp. SNU WT4]QDF66579.1 hypothetical protein FJQ87_07545 [Shewanella sp. SNU WT4]
MGALAQLIERWTKRMLLVVGIAGVLVIYLGFLYLLISGRSTESISWLFLLSPWACIFFGLSTQDQLATLHWFKAKFSRKSKG